jgi:hypothetical protein
MKIKTITCHDVYNFGASLQAYALMKYLENLGHEVEIINYKPQYLTFSLWSIGNKWKKNLFLRFIYYVYVVPKRLFQKKRREKFDLFTKRRLKLTSIKYSSIEHLKEDIPKADVYFAGSDQIWNTDSPNGKDPAFYLDFVPKESIKASYAASFSVSQISGAYFEFVKKNLKSFDFISVRENTGERILKSLEIENGSVVVDPVFLIEREEWLKISNFQSKDKYIFVYDQENNPLIKEAAKKLAKLNNLKIYAIESLYPMSYAHKKITDAGPEEFLGLISNCEICLTNSFHCISFSLIFHKKFYLYKRKHQKVNSRMIDLLTYLELNNRIGDENSEIVNIDHINYDAVNELLLIQRDSSVDFINNVIEKATLNE